MLSSEVLEHFEKVITAAVLEKYDREKAFAGTPEIYARAFQQISNIWTWCEAVRPLVFSKRLATIAGKLMGTDSVRLYHDQALYKEAGGGFTPWHCDQVYWPLSSEQTVTVWIPFQHTTLEMGPLAFAEGSHLRHVGRDLIISEESEKIVSHNVKDLPYLCTAFDLGEVSFHYGYTFHNAGPNNSQQPRRVMTMIYMDGAMRVKTPTSQSQQNDLKNWLPGLSVGDLCASELNPILAEKPWG